MVCDRCVCDPSLWGFFFSFFVLLFYRRQTSRRIMAIFASDLELFQF